MNFKSFKIRWVIALTFALFATLAVIITITSTHGIARAVASSTGPTIASDQADYAPGATVTLTGAGWASGEAVHIFVNDSVGNTWSLDSGQNGTAPDPVADANGGFTYSFSLPNSFIANYTATATGPVSGTATTTFTDAPCPAGGTTNRLTDNSVGASYTTNGNTATYTFSSFVNENPLAGVPGLIDYCVYTTPLPDSHTTAVNNWDYFTGTDNFSFGRKDGGGNSDNIPLNGTTGIEIGTTTWSGGLPTTQTILLHINDATECAKLYGSGSSSTCFVLPGTPQQAKDLTVSKTATPSFTRTFTWGITKSVDHTKLTNSSGSATFNYTVSVTHDSGTNSDWQVNGTITVNNPNGFDVTGVNVTDTISNGGTCTVTGGTNVTVPANKSVQLSYTCTYSSAPSPSSGTNTATATWTGFGSPHTSAQGTATFDFSSVSPKLVDDSVTVTDTLGGTLGTVSSSDPSPTTFTYSYTVTGTPGTCVTQDNTATFTTNTNGTTGSDSKSVQLCTPEDLQVKKDATPSFTRTFTWGITKSVDKTKVTNSSGSATFNYTVSVTHDGGTDSDWQVNGTITIKNPNDFEPITLTNVTDAVDNGGSCTVSGNTTATIAASSKVTLDYSCTYSSAPNPSSGTNTATASWDKTAASTPDDSAQGAAPFDFSSVNPKLVDDSVTVTDTLGGSLGTVSSTDPSPTTFTYSHTVTGTPGTCVTQDNTATFTTNTTKTTGSDSKSVQLCTPVDLKVKKDATPSFTRIYNWSISKSVDKTLVEQIGGTATFNYTVNVNETGFTDSDWQVNGTITITNPNDFEDIVANVSDAVDNGGNCTVSGGSGLTVPAKSSVQVSYSCTYSSAPNPSSGTNTATASWDKTAASTPDDSAQGTANFAFSTPTTTSNKTITVQDTFNGTTTTLGVLTATDAQPFASATYNYPRTVNVPQFNCVKYTNTAVIVETNQSASQTVEVCGPAKTGALTMGFWQNTNGQNIIKTSGPSTGTCALTTWLRTYAPFQDLTAASSCSQVATYVSSVINAATCGGATCNTMLKAQMLATALDVYFSDPALGGNKISAPAPIGGVTIDLTKVCTDIPTCTTFVNVSSAFGGATSLTVSQMLSYAASQSNVGGTTWYGQVKATQVLAKDAFDAINNQVAFAP